MTDDELKMAARLCFNNNFDHTDSIVVFNENNDFVRFNSTNQGLTYYASNLDKIQLECRANQGNPVGIYLVV